MNLRRLVLAVVATAAFLGFVVPADAQTQISGPTVVPDRYELTAGERVKLTITGFQADVVNMTFCGNEGRRGSTDCNVRATQAREINEDGTPTPAEMPVSAPPVPCPCILRVSSTDNLEVAIAPITLVGHPVAEVVGGSEYDIPLAVDVVANAAPEGLGAELRSSLGGTTTYDVTVLVKNRATFRIENVALAAAYTRTRFDDTRAIELPDPGPLEPGETRQETVRVDVPALTVGDVEWSATASGQGPSVTSTDTTTSRPVLLILLGFVLLIDLLLLLWRFIARRRRSRRTDADPSDSPFIDDPGGGFPDECAETTMGPEDRRRQLVG